jgi:tetratricopeptide (TPR) repeat protein
MTTSNSTLSDQRRRRFIENFTIVCFSGECWNDHLTIKLQNVVNSVHLFSDLDECVNFITTISTEKVFFICSSDRQYCISLIYQLPQIDSLYTFHSCSATQPELSTDDCSKFKGIYTDIDRLCEEIQANMRRTTYSLIGFQMMNVNSTNKDVENGTANKQDASFMYAQLLKEILLLPQSNCDQMYADNIRQLQFIDEFETNPNKYSPIWFYTAESFLYRMLNTALRVQEMGTLYKLRYFIKQLHEQIVELHTLQHEQEQLSNVDNKKSHVILYRGQAMMPQEFARLQSNIGGLLSVSNFLSTSRKEHVSRFFAESTLADLDVVSVCMSIRANTTFERQAMSTPSFACINEISSFGEVEDEVLLSMGSVFRIEKIEQSLDGIWLLSLTLTGDEDKQLRLVRESLRTRIDCDDPLLSLGKLMYATGDYYKAIDIFEQLLNDEIFISYLPNRSVLHNELAQVYKQNGDHTKAQQFYEMALLIAQQHPIGTYDHQYVAGILNNQGMLYLKQKDYSKALHYFQQALSSCEAHPTPQREHMSIFFNNLGLVHDRLGHFEQAITFYEKSLKIKHEILPANHPAIANTLHNIGDIYARQRKYKEAMEFYEETLRIEKAALPSYHPSRALTYAHIGEVLAGMGCINDAVKSLETAIEIASITLPADNSQLIHHHVRLEKFKSVLEKKSNQ